MKRHALLITLLVGTLLTAWSQSGESSIPAPGVMNQAELEKTLPDAVFFSGQVATVQLRNSGGVRWADGKLTMFVMVDSGGYSSSLRERYQFYVLSDTAFEIAGKRLSAGAYGAGFLDGPGLLVMDLGGNEILRNPYVHDAEMKRPRPLQVLDGRAPGEYRLYLGRSYVTFRQAK